MNWTFIKILTVFRSTIELLELLIQLRRKGLEPLIALAIEFTAQPVIPTNGTFFRIFVNIN
jgi:hypothetical protein